MASLTRSLALCLALLLVSPRVRAEDPVSAAKPSSPTAVHMQVTPLTAGAPAPYPGLLLDGDTFLIYLRTQVALEEANLRIASRDQLLKEQAAQNGSWWAHNGIWVGVVLGVIGSFGVVYASAKVIQTVK